MRNIHFQCTLLFLLFVYHLDKTWGLIQIEPLPAPKIQITDWSITGVVLRSEIIPQPYDTRKRLPESIHPDIHTTSSPN